MGSRCLAWKQIDPRESHWYANIATSADRKSLLEEKIFHSKSFPLQTPSINAACVEPSLPSPPSYGSPIDSRPSKHHSLFGAMHGNQSVCVAGQEGCYSLLTATGGAEAAVATVTVWLVPIWLLNEAVSMWKAVEGVCKMVSHLQLILFFDGSNDTIRISIFFPMLLFFPHMQGKS